LLLKENQKKENIEEGKIRITYYKDSGCGGQKRNKTLSGVALHYCGDIIRCCDTRDQRKNKEIAMERLRKKFQQDIVEEKLEERYKQMNRQNRNKGQRGSWVRNYNFKRDKVESEIGKYSLTKFMRGDLSDIY